MEDVYNVSWKNFPDHLKLLFLELYRTESHADVTLLSTDEVKFQAHKVVLSACSPVLKKVIDSRPPGEALMYQTGIESPELESILHLMYVGGGKFYEDRRGEYVRAATELEIEQISDNDMTYVHWRGKNIYKEEGAIHQSYKLPENWRPDQRYRKKCLWGFEDFRY